MEPLSSNGALKAILKEKIDAVKDIDSIEIAKQIAIIASEENDSTLLVFNGDYTIDSIVLDCRNVRLGIWCKKGSVTIKNCHLIGEKKSSTGHGIVVAGKFVKISFFRKLFSKY